MSLKHVKTLGELKALHYKSRNVKDELRENLILLLKKEKKMFEHIFGYEQSVLPQLECAILSRHNILLLGLRGQGKTRMARLLVNLLDEYVPVISGSELNEDPFQPISKYGKELVAEKKEKTPISWLHRNERYVEKLATPDVSIADIIGDIDVIKAMNQNINYNDERAIHFGIIPRANRGIFVINELPDLQARIQVSLFNILQERDLQIRGFKIRIPLDIMFIFTANPEDYTNRGNIVTPLKDRIGSQILTHYPVSIEVSKKITIQEASLSQEQEKNIYINEMSKNLIEQITFCARNSEYIDKKSGVSTRISISMLENVVSCAERRMLSNKEKNTHIRMSDFWATIPSMTGKLELVYEGEQEGVSIVAENLISLAIKEQFLSLFPNPEKEKKDAKQSTYKEMISWFEKQNKLELLHKNKEKEYQETLLRVKGLEAIVKKKLKNIPEEEKFFFMEFILHGLAECSMLSKEMFDSKISFKDMMSGIFQGN